MRRHWRAPREEISHTDDWLMTYADMITLLLCFFAIFLSISIPRKETRHEVAMAQRIELPVPPPELWNDKPAVRRAEIALPPRPAAHIETPVIIAAASLPRIEPLAGPLPPPETPKPASPTRFAPKGDTITSLELSSAAFFDSGSATLSKAGEDFLRSVTLDLKAEKFRDYQITVEGHTDDAPISTARFPSNWELSTARASAVVHFFLDQGLPAQKLRAAGYADTFPKAPNRDASGNPIPENQGKNRRVVIKLEKIEKAETAAPIRPAAAIAAAALP
jgi:chemotaxis protein MotB